VLTTIAEQSELKLTSEFEDSMKGRPLKIREGIRFGRVSLGLRAS
jgi:hypothetical protein